MSLDSGPKPYAADAESAHHALSESIAEKSDSPEALNSKVATLDKELNKCISLIEKMQATMWSISEFFDDEMLSDQLDQDEIDRLNEDWQRIPVEEMVAQGAHMMEQMRQMNEQQSALIQQAIEQNQPLASQEDHPNSIDTSSLSIDILDAQLDQIKDVQQHLEKMALEYRALYHAIHARIFEQANRDFGSSYQSYDELKADWRNQQEESIRLRGRMGGGWVTNFNGIRHADQRAKGLSYFISLDEPLAYPNPSEFSQRNRVRWQLPALAAPVIQHALTGVWPIYDQSQECKKEYQQERGPAAKVPAELQAEVVGDLVSTYLRPALSHIMTPGSAEEQRVLDIVQFYVSSIGEGNSHSEYQKLIQRITPFPDEVQNVIREFVLTTFSRSFDAAHQFESIAQIVNEAPAIVALERLEEDQQALLEIADLLTTIPHISADYYGTLKNDFYQRRYAHQDTESLMPTQELVNQFANNIHPAIWRTLAQNQAAQAALGPQLKQVNDWLAHEITSQFRQQDEYNQNANLLPALEAFRTPEAISVTILGYIGQRQYYIEASDPSESVLFKYLAGLQESDIAQLKNTNFAPLVDLIEHIKSTPNAQQLVDGQYIDDYHIQQSADSAHTTDQIAELGWQLLQTSDHHIGYFCAEILTDYPSEVAIEAFDYLYRIHGSDAIPFYQSFLNEIVHQERSPENDHIHRWFEYFIYFPESKVSNQAIHELSRLPAPNVTAICQYIVSQGHELSSSIKNIIVQKIAEVAPGDLTIDLIQESNGLIGQDMHRFVERAGQGLLQHKMELIWECIQVLFHDEQSVPEWLAAGLLRKLYENDSALPHHMQHGQMALDDPEFQAKMALFLQALQQLSASYRRNGSRAEYAYLNRLSALRYIARQPENIEQILQLPSNVPHLFNTLLAEGGPLHNNQEQVLEYIFANGDPLRRAKEIETIFSTAVPYWRQLYLFTDARIGDSLASANSAYPLTHVAGITVAQLVQRHILDKQNDPGKVTRLEAIVQDRSTIQQLVGGERDNIPFSSLHGMYKKLVFRDLLRRAIEMSRDKAQKARADQRNRQESTLDLQLDGGTYIHGSSVSVIDLVLHNGNLPGEALGESAKIDSYPFQVDFGCLTDKYLEEQQTTRAVFENSISSQYGKSGEAGGQGQLYYVYQRNADSYEPGVAYGRAAHHALMLGGMPASEISALVLTNPDKSLPKASQAIVENGFFIPIYNIDGQLIFTSQDYDQLRREGNYAVPVETWDYSLRTGEQLGSNPGGEYTVPTNQGAVKFYVKFAGQDNSEQIWNEQLADNIYRYLGVPVPETKIVKIETSYGHASRLLPEDQDPGDIESLADGFIFDALLANWDIVANNKNVLFSDGKPYRVDNGGSLLFRARGERKEQYGAAVTELDTMRSSYPNLSAERIQRQLAILSQKFTDEAVDQIVDSVRLNQSDRDDLKMLLRQRRDYILQHYANLSDQQRVEHQLQTT